jgi:HK97 family phage portal protein
MLQSNGVLVKGSVVLWQGHPRDWPDHITTGTGLGSLAELYRRQLWVHVVIDKRGKAAARLPFKVYEHADDGGRPDASASPFGQLMRRPCRAIDPFLFWLWTASTKDIYGESAWLKLRDAGGRPIELLPVHPTKLIDEVDEDTGNVTWKIRLTGADRDIKVERRDLVIHREYNPDTIHRGMSKLEPLRATLENEDGARRANSALWRNGGRPSTVLRHPGMFKSDAVQRRLSAQWTELQGGVDNWAKALILEEGMEAQFVPLDVEELQYIEARKLNREEVCAAFDMSPPVVHILDRATFSNVVEQHRSMYRDTMGAVVGGLESTIEFELRDGRFGDTSADPDFGDVFYGEFLMDEVLRADFEARQAALATAQHLTIAEKREIENRPFIPGTEFIFLNSAMLPLGEDGQLVKPAAPAPPPAPPPEEDEAAAIGTPPPPKELPPAGGTRSITPRSVRSAMGRLSRCRTMADVKADMLVNGLDMDAVAILEQLISAQLAGESVDELKNRLRAMAQEGI